MIQTFWMNLKFFDFYQPMLSNDLCFFYSKIENHDLIFSISPSMMSYYNTLISLPWCEDWEAKIYEEERNQFKFYDC